MEAAIAGLLSKISDPTVIALGVLLGMSEWMRITQTREERADRAVLVKALNDLTERLTESLHEVRNTLAALTGRPLP